MKRIAAAIALALMLGSCSGGAHRPLERYYDPQGLFSADLPAANEVSVLPPQNSSSGPSLLSGVSSAPASATPSAGAGTDLGVGTSVQSDQTQYRVFVLTGDTYATVQDLSLLQMSDPNADLKTQQAATIGGHDGLLIVADYKASAQSPAFSAASGFLLVDGMGYWISAVFPAGGWGGEKGDFMNVLRSFRTDVPPGVALAPLSDPNA
ncbi:MAG: hypothetical protein M3P01_02195 [Actinomycetota bacterium]|nr:hypothetical protein [Actinomycetota bacterium]